MKWWNVSFSWCTLSAGAVFVLKGNTDTAALLSWQVRHFSWQFNYLIISLTPQLWVILLIFPPLEWNSNCFISNRSHIQNHISTALRAQTENWKFKCFQRLYFRHFTPFQCSTCNWPSIVCFSLNCNCQTRKLVTFLNTVKCVQCCNLKMWCKLELLLSLFIEFLI